MKILWILGSILLLVMGGMIYLSYSLNNIINSEQSLLGSSSTENVQKKNNIFDLPPVEVRKKLDQLNDLKNDTRENHLVREPAQDDNENNLELSNSIREYNLNISQVMSEQYHDLIVSSQGLSLEEIEERRLQILQHKKTHGILPEFIETIPFDSVLAVKMIDKNIEELEMDEIQKIRENYSYAEIKNYYDKRNMDTGRE